MKMGTKIVPTIGRVVLYVPGPGDHAAEGNQPHAATVAFVHNDNLVNLSIVDANGMQYARTEVPLVNEGETSDALHGFCHWMPYQKAVAAGEILATLHAIPPPSPAPDNGQGEGPTADVQEVPTPEFPGDPKARFGGIGAGG